MGRLEKFVFQPFADRYVIEPVCGIGDEDCKQKCSGSDKDMCAERCILVVFHPCHLHVDQRIMGDVERKGYVAEKLVDAFRGASLYTASGPMDTMSGKKIRMQTAS